MGAVIRAARPTDVERIGAIWVAAWQVAYRGVMPDAFLGGLDPAERAEMWRRFRESDPPDRHLDVVLDAAGGVAGFVSYGPANDGQPGTGELYSINLHPGSWGHGLGSTLVVHVADALRDVGFGHAVLWVERSNTRACAVYERAGWWPNGATRHDAVMGTPVDLVRYRIDLDSAP